MCRYMNARAGAYVSLKVNESVSPDVVHVQHVSVTVLRYRQVSRGGFC